MFPWKLNLSSRQKNFSSMPNSHQYIIVHHTGTPDGTLQGNIKVLLGETRREVSAHCIVDTDGLAYKLGRSEQTLWHAGKSVWGSLVGMNYHSIGIEIIGPTNSDFTNEQRGTVKAIIGHFMAVYKIPAENVLRHADITHTKSYQKMLWDGVSTNRKTDVDKSLFKNFKNWDEYRRSIIVQEVK